MNKLLVFTDLDGSLLDHDTYSHAAADPLLAELEQQGVPVIPCTSKTRAELLPLREALGNRHPFIIENGAAVIIPAGYFPQPPAGVTEQDGLWVKSFVPPSSHWLQLLAQVEARYPGCYRALSQLSADEIAALTGLPLEDAERAAQREYGEPLQWLGNEQQKIKFMAELVEQGAHFLQGGRFLHLSGECDKGRALRWLSQVYAELWQQQPTSIAIGDSHNDIAMLEAADRALIIRSPVHAPPQLQRREGVLLSPAEGPQGWAEGLTQILQELQN